MTNDFDNNIIILIDEEIQEKVLLNESVLNSTISNARKNQNG